MAEMGPEDPAVRARESRRHRRPRMPLERGAAETRAPLLPTKDQTLQPRWFSPEGRLLWPPIRPSPALRRHWLRDRRYFRHMAGLQYHDAIDAPTHRARRI